MKLFLLTLVVFVLALLGLSVGVIFRNRQIRSSCGGLSQLEGNHGKFSCDACSSGGEHCGSVRTTWDTNTLSDRSP
ncbi:MAG: hypothetical protein ACODAD_06910 [Planctomycetota bacterium]